MTEDDDPGWEDKYASDEPRYHEPISVAAIPEVLAQLQVSPQELGVEKYDREFTDAIKYPKKMHSPEIQACSITSNTNDVVDMDEPDPLF
eukprot:CAMPEP_0170177062 /NCGR_PEP_ID=MMETSP0040_2-20121228/9792_1 /TAXON_ID=641309 /ORGANISM="Lotharella oceanica, Strain CCMP622" /LENGTH=89 /DNA_ID=CAMNT_0010419573 /DNA_START=1112 /DNA_END=1381 /DNA_ORIENTATION=+